MTHKGQKRFKCENCDTHGLKKYIECVHEGKKLRKRDICEKNYAEKISLNA